MKILFIHGMMGGGWYWEKYIKFFSDKGFDVFAPTLKFHDENPPPAELGKLSIKDYVSEILEIEPPDVLVGHSMGGLIALLVAEKINPKYLILLTPAPPYGMTSSKLSPVITFLPVLKWRWWEKPFKLPYWSFSYSILNMVPEEERRTLYERFNYESGRVLFEIGFWFLDKYKSTKVDFDKISSKTLVIAGKYDKITPLDVVEKIARKVRGEFKVFESGHWVVGEKNWKDIAEYILKFISS